MSIASPSTPEERRIADAVDSAFDAGVACERERCAKIAESEPEPTPGTMPDKLKIVPLEAAVRAAIRATKKSIAAAIRNTVR